MLEIDDLFAEIARRLDLTSKSKLGLSEEMGQWIDWCEAQFPAKIWTELRELDYEGDYQRLSRWLKALLETEPPGPKIKGLYFGLCNPSDKRGRPSSQMYLAGSTRFNKPDWPCNPAYFPEGRYAPSEVLPVIYAKCERLKGDGSYLGEPALGHAWVAAVVARWLREPMRELLLGDAERRGIGFGHDSGDVYLAGEIVRKPK